MKPPIPILRIFDEAKAREFYIAFLRFKVDWEHRFCEGMPLYMQVSRGECVLHLSEHHGDASPGASVRIHTPNLDEYLKILRKSQYKHCRPGEPALQPWGLREIHLADPFGNRLILYTRISRVGPGDFGADRAGRVNTIALPSFGRKKRAGAAVTIPPARHIFLDRKLPPD